MATSTTSIAPTATPMATVASTNAPMGMTEGTSFSAQFSELNPIMHLGEGHIVTAALLTILWLLAIYAVYKFIKK